MSRSCPSVVRLRWPLLLLLAASLPYLGGGPVGASAQEPGGSGEDPGVQSLSPEHYDLIRRTLVELHEDLVETDPSLPPDALRGRLLVEARQLVNNVANAGLDPEQLLLLPEPLKQDASNLVNLVLGDRPPPTPPEPNPADPDAPQDDADAEAPDAQAPVRLRPFEEILARVLADRFEEFQLQGEADAPALLEREAVSLAARAVSPSDDPRDLVPAERAFAVALARRIARGDEGALPGPTRGRDPRLQDDLDALAEILRRKNAEWKLSGEITAIAERIDALERLGAARLEEAIRARDPEGSVPESARDQLRALAELIARGVPVALPPASEDPEPTTPTPTPPTDDPRPPVTDAEPIDPALLARIAALARAADRGLIAAGLDLATRREALRQFLREQAAHRSGRDPHALPPGWLATLDQEVERILAEHQGVGGGGGVEPAPPTWIVQPPVITVPPVSRPIGVIVPDARPKWCPPWFKERRNP